MLLLKQRFQFDSVSQEEIVSVTIGLAAIFAFFGGFFAKNFGRRRIIIASSVLFGKGSDMADKIVIRQIALINLKKLFFYYVQGVVVATKTLFV